jgi:hypothetical protein
MRPSFRVLAACALLVCAPPGLADAQSASQRPEPGSRVLLDAHNCYPYNGRWADRIDRALSTGTPLAIEQDLVWFRDPLTGEGRSLVAHDEQGKPNLGLDGSEPTMREYFFERIRPLVERALVEQRRDTWPIITLNLDLKTEEPEHLAAIWALLREYRPWLTTARRTENLSDIQPMTFGPLLVLTGESDAQRKAFYDDVPAGQELLVFGAARPRSRKAGIPGTRTNYHRWWNNPWSVVEARGQRKAGAWTRKDEARLNFLVEAAHRAGLWIRFYTLNGHDPRDTSGGWSKSYNFGSQEAARERWEAAIRAGVDFIAVDQYELFAETLHRHERPPQSGEEIVMTGDLTGNDHKRLFERAFDVPAGTARVEVTLSYTGADERTVIDLGLRSPQEFRGWSGGGPQTIFVGATRASYGYLPGVIEPGRWAVILGVPNIRAGRRDTYTITVRLSSDEDAKGPTVRAGPGWFAGDLHSHSGHSDGRATTRRRTIVPVPPDHVFDAARAAGLDFVALTDHNSIAQWLDVDRLQPYYDDLLLLHAREITTYEGHANAIGEQRFHDFRLGEKTVKDVLANPAADGAFVSINHPMLPGGEQCMGCRWDHADAGTLSHVEGVEVLNGTARTGPQAGWPFWADLLNRGYRLTAVGGSDEHTPEEPHDRRIGTPTTVVFASELSERAIVAGLKSGRVYIRTRGPDGPRLEFFAESGGRRYDMGEVVPATRKITLRANVAGAPMQRVTWIRNGKPIGASDIPESGDLLLDSDTNPGDWFTLVVHDAGGDPTVFANAIYVR